LESRAIRAIGAVLLLLGAVLLGWTSQLYAQREAQKLHIDVLKAYAQLAESQPQYVPFTTREQQLLNSLESINHLWELKNKRKARTSGKQQIEIESSFSLFEQTLQSRIRTLFDQFVWPAQDAQLEDTVLWQ
jgi:hypothetical protein